MYLSSSSPAAVRFLASIKDGRGLKPSSRLAGISKTVGYRFLEEVYLRQRRSGILAKDVLSGLGFQSSLVQVWGKRVDTSNDRHHFRVAVEDESAVASWTHCARTIQLGWTFRPGI